MEDTNEHCLKDLENTIRTSEDSNPASFFTTAKKRGHLPIYIFDVNLFLSKIPLCRNNYRESWQRMWRGNHGCSCHRFLHYVETITLGVGNGCGAVTTAAVATDFYIM